jgi:signal transduction histidine kinase
MTIKRLLLETVFVLVFIVFLITSIDSLNNYNYAEQYVSRIQEQYFDATYEIYKDEIIGDLLLGEKNVTVALLQEIAKRRSLGVSINYNNNEMRIGKIEPSSPKKTYKLDLGDSNVAFLALSICDFRIPWFIRNLGISLFLDIFVLGLGFIYLWYRFNKRLLTPLARIVSHLNTAQLEECLLPKFTAIEAQKLLSALKLMNTEIRKKAIYEAEANTAKQVAHDIKSPLGSLIMLLSQSATLPEHQRKLMHTAIKRISDIVNSLYKKSLNNIDNCKTQKDESLMVASLVESLISEKRIQISNKDNIKINLNIENAYGLFAKIDSVEMKRVLSNLINNSIESFDEKPHTINITVLLINHFIQILIEDDGKGIPEEIIPNVGECGFSYGKEDLTDAGVGLGIFYAIKTIKSFGGLFRISSKLDVGTVVTIELPQSKAPNWFIDKIDLQNIDKIIVLDDDQSIHDFWRNKFSTIKKNNFDVLYFSSGRKFYAYCLEKIETFGDKTLFLVDFNLQNEEKSGLDLIEELNLVKQAILVTSYDEDLVIHGRVGELAVKMIPKGVATLIPIYPYLVVTE